jgi:hypothetical protein
MLLKKDSEGGGKTILIQERHIATRANCHPLVRLKIKFSSFLKLPASRIRSGAGGKKSKVLLRDPTRHVLKEC